MVMQGSRTAVAAGLLLLAMLAGCSGPQGFTAGTLDGIERFDGFTWATPQHLGPNGSIFADGAAPHHVEQLSPMAAVTQKTFYDPLDFLSLITMSPPVAVDDQGGVYVATLDEIHKSSNGGANWTKVLDFVRFQEEQGIDRWETTDHALWYDQPSGTLYALFSNLNGCQLVFASQDGAQTWSVQSPAAWPASCADLQDVSVLALRVTFRPQIVAGPRADAFTALPGQADHNLYVCEESAVGIKCASSFDGGKTYPYEALIAPPADGCATYTFGHGDTRSDGAVAFPLGTPTPSLNYMYLVNGQLIQCPDGPPTVSYSTDGGLSWQVARAPDGLVMSGDYPSLAFSSSGTAYLAYRSGEQTIQVLRSPDLFNSWQGPFNVSLPQHVLSDHPAIAVGDDGRVSVTYLASTTKQSRGDEPGELPPTPDHADTGTIWHLFVATSIDADSDTPSWYVQQISPMEDPMHMGCIYGRQVIDWSSYNYACYNMGLWSDMAVGPDGRVYTSLIDGCTPRNGCATDVAGAYAYRDRQVAVATLDNGEGLLASAGVLPSLGLVHPQPISEDDQVYTS